MRTDSKAVKTRHKLTAAVFIAAIAVFFFLNLLLSPPEILTSERRPPADFPKLSVEAVLSAEFMNEFEGFAADRFPLRESFRELHAFFALDVMMQSDKSGIYRDDAVGAGEFRSTDPEAFRRAAEKIKALADSMDDMNVYYSLIPDKSMFAARYMPGYNHSEAEAALGDVLSGCVYIPIAETLGADSFYRTDLHWNQTKISSTAEFILESMGARRDETETETVAAGDFYGVYAGQLALPLPADSLEYIVSPSLRASYLNEKTLSFESGEVYPAERFNGVDPYDIFLGGPQPLVEIENKAAKTERELYLFRDSFGSSLAPLLAAGYSKITLIDLRYINAELLPQFVDFKAGADVLFIYSSQILGNPGVLQV